MAREFISFLHCIHNNSIINYVVNFDENEDEYGKSKIL